MSSEKEKICEPEDICPICLCEPDPGTVGPCGHLLCIPCMDRILLSHKNNATIDYQLQQEYSNPDAHLSAPTLGRCPICRAELSLFDLMKGDDRKSSLIEKNFDLMKTPIAGLVYAWDGQVGNASYHFPQMELSESWDKDSQNRPLPFVNYDNVGTNIHFDNGSKPPKRKCFQEGCHFHEKSRTFHGTLVWSTEQEVGGLKWNGCRAWDVIIQFSSDLRYVSNGILVKRREAPAGVQHPWPLDGRWQVTWDREENAEPQYIEVVGGNFRLGPFQYSLDMHNPTSPRFTWPMTEFGDSATLYTALCGVDLVAHPKGPALGSTVVWTTTDPERISIKWTRQSIREQVSHDVQRFGPGSILYRQIGGLESSRASTPTYHADTIWGNTFVQALKVGLASYHFVSKTEGAYISYEHPQCGGWPPLDDGSPVPPRVSFRQVEWNGLENTFRGQIMWEEEYGTTWQGAQTWIYEIIFDSEYTCVISGKVRMIVNNQVHEMSTFGDILVYINAAITEKISSLEEEIDTIAEESYIERSPFMSDSPRRYIRFEIASTALRQRLEDERASVRTLEIMHGVLARIQQTETEAIDFNIS